VFAVATLLPLPLLALGALWGGFWLLLACLYLTVFVFALDELTAYAGHDAPAGSEFPAADWLSLLLGLVSLPIFALGVAAVSGATELSGIERAAAFVAVGLYAGQVLFSNAHELIHRPGKLRLALGTVVYASAYYGHHVTAHRFIHHRYVGSPEDPNTARLGEGFWRFALRAWAGALLAGLEVERSRRRGRRKGAMALFAHPHLHYGLLTLAMVGAMTLAFGSAGLAAHGALSFYAVTQIPLADYVQHYGLVRERLPNGKLEPIGLAHSWNAPHRASSALMLNAPRHSDHHVSPMKAFPALELPSEADAPTLPASLPAMSTLALFPPLWRKLMDPRAAAWRAPMGDTAREARIAAE